MNVRAKGRVVNSVFLVQLRKMLVADFVYPQGLRTWRKNPLEPRAGRGSSGRREEGNEYAEGARRVVHRGRTGNAEREPWRVSQDL
jgi:hypothetical protein